MRKFFEILYRIWHLPDLRKNILFILGMLAIFRLVAHIPIPGANIENLRNFFRSNDILGFLNLFSGGTMENFSVVALGVAPYITASIIFQLLAMVIPALEEIMKEGEAGQRKINQWTRIATVPLAALQAFGMISLLRQSPKPILGEMTIGTMLLTILTMTAGTMFLMWIGELISERKLGNGVSLLIFAGIIAGLPSRLQQAMLGFDPSQIFNLFLFLIIVLVTISGVVYITEAQRNIPVSYARQIRGMRVYGGVNTFLPLRVNMAGVIPIIFAISVILFPPMLAQFFLRARSQFLVRSAEIVLSLFHNQIFYGILYFLLVVGFTYFYTAVIFHPLKIAENLQKQGGFIPGIRPGKSTAEYLNFVTNRILLAGALFLGVIAVLPMILRQISGSQALVIGGTSVLIVVSVVLETIRQIDAQLTMHEYEKV